jgi:glycosyltransferase involved in cell wall biosynthesis
MTMPRVSVIIPVYQTERYIAAALGSVLAQTFSDFEVIVVDDGSRDRGPDIARDFGDRRVRIVTQANRGLAGARNTGIRNARGDLIALLDADDLWEPTKLAQHVAQLDGDPTLDVSFSASRLIDEDGADLGLVQSPLDGRLGDEDFLCRNPVGNGSAPVIRRSALERIVYVDGERGYTCWFDESFRQSEDVECWLRLKVMAGCRFGYVDAALTLYRVNSGGLSANVEAQLATWRRFRDKVASYAPGLIETWGARAEGYQLRYLARRAVRSSNRSLGLGLAVAAVRAYPAMLIEEPVRTAATFAAAGAKMLVPGRLFEQVSQAALVWASSRPGLRL